jgi:lysyl-tRNA synthetase class 2
VCRCPTRTTGVTDVEQRYRRRTFDLMMNEDSRAALCDAHRKIVQEVRAVSRRRGLPRGRDADPPAALRRRLRRAVRHALDELDRDLYLRIADELYLKRLIVGGLEKVYELSKDFRNESISYKHSPEFTQVEWYEAYADYRDTMERTEALVERAALGSIGTTKVQFRGHDVELARPWRRIKFVDALDQKGVWSRDADELRAKLNEAGVDTTRDTTWVQLADHAYSHFVEPELIEPTIVYDWPLEMSPFARTTDGDETIVERFECVVGGMEFANAFSELNDSEEQAQRFAMQEDERAAGDARRSPATRTSSRRLPTGCRRRAAAASASTGSRWCSRAAMRSGT